jgi:exosome complex exonuclease DIS3/RRP44
LPSAALPLSAMVEITIHKRPRTEAVVTQRKFFKRTAKGKVIKGMHPLNTIMLHLQIYTWTVVPERYLRDRDDVGCELPEGKHCLDGKKEILPRNGDTPHSPLSICWTPMYSFLR